jgi:hypothetical protein
MYQDKEVSPRGATCLTSRSCKAKKLLDPTYVGGYPLFAPDRAFQLNLACMGLGARGMEDSDRKSDTY